jgi:hypothetical protein
MFSDLDFKHPVVARVNEEGCPAVVVCVSNQTINQPNVLVIGNKNIIRGVNSWVVGDDNEYRTSSGFIWGNRNIVEGMCVTCYGNDNAEREEDYRPDGSEASMSGMNTFLPPRKLPKAVAARVKAAQELKEEDKEKKKKRVQSNTQKADKEKQKRKRRKKKEEE